MKNLSPDDLDDMIEDAKAVEKIITDINLLDKFPSEVIAPTLLKFVCVLANVENMSLESFLRVCKYGFDMIEECSEDLEKYRSDYGQGNEKS